MLQLLTVFAVGLDEAFGYGGVALGTWVTGVIAAQYGLQPAPFYFLACVIVLALVATVLFVEETLPYARAEADGEGDDVDGTEITSTITSKFVERLGLEEGSTATAVIKASDVMVDSE